MNNSTFNIQYSTLLKISLLFLILTLLMVLPVLPVFSTAIAGGPVARRDAWQNVWNLWWVQQALSEGRSPFVTPMLYHPEGADLSLQTLNVTNGLLVFPVTAVWGPVAGYNTALILGFVLSGLGAYALALEMVKKPAAALLSACLFTFSPFHVTKLWDGQLELIAMQWLPLYALFLLRSARYARWRDGLLAGLFLALIGYTSWYYFLFTAVYSVLFVLLFFVARRPHSSTVPQPRIDRYIAVMALAAITGAGLLLPVLLPALRAVGVGDKPIMGSVTPDTLSYLKVIHSADLIDPWLPSALHPVWGHAVSQIGARLHPYIAAWNIALGYVAMLLALLAMLCWRQAWRWWLLMLAGLLLALGPQLQVNGVNTGILLPYVWLTHIPGVDIAHRPSHFIVISMLALIPLAALGLEAVLERTPQRMHWSLVVSLAALACIELLPPKLLLTSSQLHPYYQGLVGQAGAVMDLPPRMEGSEPLEAQMIHGLPIMGGFVSRMPFYPFAEYTPAIRDLWAMQLGNYTLIPSGKDNALAIFNTYDVRHVLIHWSDIPSRQRKTLRQALAEVLPDIRPIFEDENLTAYRIPEVKPQTFAFFRTGWYTQEYDQQRRWRWMTERGEIMIHNPHPIPQPMQLTLKAQSYTETSDVRYSFNQTPAGIWHVTRNTSILTLYVLLPPGESHIWFEAPTSTEQAFSKRDLSIVIVDQNVVFGEN